MSPERDPEAAFAAFLGVWQQLLGEADEDQAVVVVEGERDVRSIRRLGWKGEVTVVHRGHTLAETAHALEGRARRVIVLTDWDSEGGELARRFRGFLGPKTLDLDYRRKLARVLRGELVHVEGLYGWARRNAERLGASLEELLETEPLAGAGGV